MWLLVSVASAGTVCASGDSGCDHDDLGEALASNDPALELQPGRHQAGLAVSRVVAVTTLPGATLFVDGLDQPALYVTNAASGSTFTGLVYEAAGPSDGPLMTVDGATVTVTDAVISSATSIGPPPAFRVIGGATVTLERPVVLNSYNLGDGMIRVDDSTLIVNGGSFRANNADRGGAIWASHSDVTITDTTFDEQYAYAEGNTLWMQNGSLVVTNGTIAGETSGTQVELWAVESARFDGVAFTAANEGATALHAEDVETLELAGTVFSDWQRGAVTLGTVGSLVLDGAVFHGNRSNGSGGALAFAGVGDLRIADSWFCDNRADFYGGALQLGACSGSCTISNAVFQDNRSDAGGGAVSSTNRLAIDHSTFVANEGSPGGAVYSNPSTVDMNTSIVIRTRGGTAALTWPEGGVFDTNGLGDNQSTDASFRIPATNEQGLDVVFVDDAGPCGAGVELADVPSNQWLVENGVGAVLVEVPVVDGDGDGIPSDVDCDDTRSDVYAGAPEVPGDGIDQDCDGLEVCPLDADGDGFAGNDDGLSPLLTCVATRGDCDDRSATVFPGAFDTWYDGVDSDCIGNDDQDQDADGIPVEQDCDDTRAELGACVVRIGGGCRTVPLGSAGWIALLVGGFVRRRSR